VGHSVLHILDKELENAENSYYIGMEVSCNVDRKRRI